MIARAEHAFSPRENFVGGCSPLISSCGISTGCWSSCDEDASATGLLILFSAVLEKSLALTITGIFGRTPLPRTLKYPWINTMLKKLRSNFIWFFYYLILQKGELKLNVRLTDLVTSITGALSLDFSAAFLVCSETSDHNLSVLTVGQCFQFLCRWKTLIPDFP